MLTREALLYMRNMPFEDIDLAEMPDLDQMDFNETKSKKEKILGILEVEKNPYFVKSGNIVVKVGFASTSCTIEESLCGTV